MNRYSQPSPQGWTVGAPASTSALLGQVLGITGAGFLITAVAAYATASLQLSSGLSLIAMLVGFGFLFAISGTRGNSAMSLLMFYLFAICEGVGIAPLLAAYIQLDGPGVVVEAATTTGLGMLTLAAVVGLTSFDYRRLSGIAFGLLLGLVVASIVSIFVRFVHPTTLSWGVLAVFSLLTLVDFARIKAGGDGLTPVEMATSIYLDGINIFIALLQIFGGRRRSD